MGSFQTLDLSEIAVGQPVKEELWTKVKCSLDDHESRMNALEAGANKFVIFDSLIHNASAGTQTSGGLNIISLSIAQSSFNIVTAILTVLQAGTAGTVEFDLLRNTTADYTTATTMFSTKPSVAFGAGDFAKSVNAVFTGPGAIVAQNDHIYLDVTSLQDEMGAFHVHVFGEP